MVEWPLSVPIYFGGAVCTIDLGWFSVVCYRLLSRWDFLILWFLGRFLLAMKLGATPAWDRQLVVRPPPGKPSVTRDVGCISAEAQARTSMCVARGSSQIKARTVDLLTASACRAGFVSCGILGAGPVGIVRHLLRLVRRRSGRFFMMFHPTYPIWPLSREVTAT